MTLNKDLTAAVDQEIVEEQKSTTIDNNLTPDEYKQIDEKHDKIVKSFIEPEDYTNAQLKSIPMLGRDSPECISRINK